MDRTCEECGADFVGRSKAHRFCGDTCRKAANRRPSKRGKRAPAGDAPAPPPKATRDTVERGGLVAAVAAELSAINAIDSVNGRAALALAYRIESPMESGSAAASMTKELSRLMTDARASAPKAGDGIDSLEEAVGAKLRLVHGA